MEFDDHRDADDAVYELNGKELCSERVTIEHARSRRGRGGGPGMGRFSSSSSSYRPSRSSGSRYGPPVRTDHRLIVENLSSRISWQVRDDGTISLTTQAFKNDVYHLLMTCIIMKQHSFYRPGQFGLSQIILSYNKKKKKMFSLVNWLITIESPQYFFFSFLFFKFYFTTLSSQKKKAHVNQNI